MVFAAGAGLMEGAGRWGFDAGVYFNLFDNSGLGGYAFRGQMGLGRPKKIVLCLGYQHEEWRDWLVGENRAYLLFEFRKEWFALDAGIGRRAPFFDRRGYCLPWWFSGATGEWNLLYRVECWPVRNKRFGFGLFLANISRHQMYNPQMFPGGIAGVYRLTTGMTVFGDIQSGIKGLSAALFSPAEVRLRLGMNIARAGVRL